jgi:hypothetical protein
MNWNVNGRNGWIERLFSILVFNNFVLMGKEKTFVTNDIIRIGALDCFVELF